MAEYPSDTQAAIDAGKALGDLREVADHGKRHVLVPEGFELRAVDIEHDRPFAKTGERTLKSPQSFGDYVKRHATSDTVIYADVERARIVAVLDDHGDMPGHRKHRAVYECPRSEQWAQWRRLNGQKVGQSTFLEFLEDRLPDISEPDGADVMEIIRDMQGRKDVAWKSAVDLRSGGVQLRYEETVTAESKRGGEITIPKELKVKVEIFYKASFYLVPIRVRFRVDNGALSFVLMIDNLVLTEQRAFGEVVEMIQGMVGEDVLILEGVAG